MTFSFEDGFCYTTYNITHPLVESFYSKRRFRLNPEVVTKLCEDIPELRAHLDYEFYKLWSEHRLDTPKIKTSNRFLFENYNFKIEPFDHQKKAISFILHTPAQALFAEPGTGKTFCALVAAEMRLRQGLCKKVLVISPASVMRTGWYADLKKFTDLNGIVVHGDKWKWHCPKCGTRQYRYDKAVKHADKCGVSEREIDPELIWNNWSKAPDILANVTDYQIYITSINLVHLYLDDFLAAGFDNIILDESTMIKNPSATTSTSIRKLGHTAKYRLAMTGTPVTNELEDIWSQMQFVDMSLDSTISKFRSKYYWQHPANHFIKKPHVDAGQRIADVTRNGVLRIKKSECLDLPPRLRRIREVEPSPSIKKVYKEFYAELYALHKGEEIVAFNTFTEILRLHQIINGYWTRPGEEEVHVIDDCPPKVKEVLDIVSKAKEKVIIWTFYREDARILKRELEQYNPSVVNGKTKSVEDEVKRFLNDDSCRVMIAHPKSARFGHTWVVADTTIFYTYGYSVEDYWQARDRNHRIGQVHSVNEIFLSSGGIEGEIINAVVKNEDFSKNIMENFDPMMRRFSL